MAKNSKKFTTNNLADNSKNFDLEKTTKIKISKSNKRSSNK